MRAALYASALSNFVCVHLSGGTTEVLKVGRGLSIARLGSTTDISAGQLVDRIGVALGLPFPSGPHLEALAAGAGEACPRSRSASAA